LTFREVIADIKWHTFYDPQCIWQFYPWCLWLVLRRLIHYYVFFSTADCATSVYFLIQASFYNSDGVMAPNARGYEKFPLLTNTWPRVGNGDC